MSKCEGYWENRACNFAIFIYLCMRTSLLSGKAWLRDVFQLHCCKLDVIKIFRIWDDLWPLWHLEDHRRRQLRVWLIALCWLLVSDLSQPEGGDGLCSFQNPPQAALPGSVLVWSSQPLLRSVIHTLHSWFSMGKTPLCLPEALAPFPHGWEGYYSTVW